MSEWVRVYQAANSLEAHAIKGALEVSGIKVQLKGEALAGALGELPANAIEVTLHVRPKDITQSQLILTRYQQEPRPDWYCSHCGEHNAGSFELCWQCGQDAKVLQSEES
ncbi:DUF2007 domain-containing protein [Oceanisphaera pacifica]|uniref:DUF2007 domain-containing protein n=1 Tax=Oceanisphaera pacifica TaxID=2818389 RepID=A0ABS3NGA2_9GAMM|nr:DUF2007 domain-containing protein [Oceanisphaera pacifica]MBO1519609.1 DUF2007 domain-containing protein [Oceanisphaera pacifica]